MQEEETRFLNFAREGPPAEAEDCLCCATARRRTLHFDGDASLGVWVEVRSREGKGGMSSH